MGNPYKHLLAPLQIGSVFLKNRTIYPNACPHFLQGPESYPADSYIAQYAAFARAGAALIEMAEWNNYPGIRDGSAPVADFAHMPAFNLKDLSVQNYFSALAEDVHFYGSKMLIVASPELPRKGPGGMPPALHNALPDASGDLNETMPRKKKKTENPKSLQKKGMGMDGGKREMPNAGYIDMVNMARAFIAEPEYEIKLKENRAKDITPCIWCNLCHGDLRAPWISVCSVSPRMGLEHKLNRMIAPAETKKKVAVIGGGPAGMKAAITAAQREHQVTLFEKTDYLGGQMLHAEYFSFKWSIRDYRNYLVETDRPSHLYPHRMTKKQRRNQIIGFGAVCRHSPINTNAPSADHC